MTSDQRDNRGTVAAFAWRLAKDESNDPIVLRSERDEARGACERFAHVVGNLSNIISEERDSSRLAVSGKRRAEAAVDSMASILKETAAKIAQLTMERDTVIGERDGALRQLGIARSERDTAIANHAIAKKQHDEAKQRKKK